MFSNRLGTLEESDLWRRLSAKRAAGDDVIDLTDSNPTRLRDAYPGEAILAALADASVLTYAPSPRGHPAARHAVAHYYRGHGKHVGAEDLVLTASTSEAYGFLFKLLCDPGDTVLVPRPSYPLFDTLARLEGVDSVPYTVEHGPPATLPPRCRAVLAVHPNNPTGEYVPDEVRERLLKLSENEEVALIVDEVFLDFPLRRAPAASFAGGDRGLVLTLSGLSKLAGLPQMKLAWIALGGARQRVDAARLRLDHIADAYLSVGPPVQHGTPRLLELAPGVRAHVRERAETNLLALERAIARVPEATLLLPEGGWYATIRLPAIESSEGWALDFLEHASVYVHPGSLFGFDGDAYVVVSLLPDTETFARAVGRVLGIVSDRVDSSGE